AIRSAGTSQRRPAGRWSRREDGKSTGGRDNLRPSPQPALQPRGGDEAGRNAEAEPRKQDEGERVHLGDAREAGAFCRVLRMILHPAVALMAGASRRGRAPERRCMSGRMYASGVVGAGAHRRARRATDGPDRSASTERARQTAKASCRHASPAGQGGGNGRPAQFDEGEGCLGAVAPQRAEASGVVAHAVASAWALLNASIGCAVNSASRRAISRLAVPSRSMRESWLSLTPIWGATAPSVSLFFFRKARSGVM